MTTKSKTQKAVPIILGISLLLLHAGLFFAVRGYELPFGWQSEMTQSYIQETETTNSLGGCDQDVIEIGFPFIVAMPATTDDGCYDTHNTAALILDVLIGLFVSVGLGWVVAAWLAKRTTS